MAVPWKHRHLATGTIPAQHGCRQVCKKSGEISNIWQKSSLSFHTIVPSKSVNDRVSLFSRDSPWQLTSPCVVVNPVHDSAWKSQRAQSCTLKCMYVFGFVFQPKSMNRSYSLHCGEQKEAQIFYSVFIFISPQKQQLHFFQTVFFRIFYLCFHLWNLPQFPCMCVKLLGTQYVPFSRKLNSFRNGFHSSRRFIYFQRRILPSKDEDWFQRGCEFCVVGSNRCRAR